VKQAPKKDIQQTLFKVHFRCVPFWAEDDHSDEDISCSSQGFLELITVWGKMNYDNCLGLIETANYYSLLE